MYNGTNDNSNQRQLIRPVNQMNATEQVGRGEEVLRKCLDATVER